MSRSDSSSAPDVAAIHRALASPVRVRMLRLIGERTQAVSDLADACRVSVSMTSRHVHALAACGLITRERSGSCVVQRLTPAGRAALTLWSGSAETEAAASHAAAEALARPAWDLTHLTPDDVDFVLHYGLTAFACGWSDRDEWLRRLSQEFGTEWRPRLPTVWTAAMRLFRGEGLDGLPLPPPVAAAPPAVPVLRPAERAAVPGPEER